MAAHRSILAWEIPWTGEPGGLPSMGSPQLEKNHVVPTAWQDEALALWGALGSLPAPLCLGACLRRVHLMPGEAAPPHGDR